MLSECWFKMVNRSRTDRALPTRTGFDRTFVIYRLLLHSLPFHHPSFPCYSLAFRPHCGQALFTFPARASLCLDSAPSGPTPPRTINSPTQLQTQRNTLTRSSYQRFHLCPVPMNSLKSLQIRRWAICIGGRCVDGS